jgi:hypothetical protein
MSFNMDDVQIGGQLRVGTGICNPIKEGDYKINGTALIEGPVVFGGPTEFDDNVATLMVGRTKNDDKDCVPADRSLWVKGNVLIEGDTGTAQTLYIDSSRDTAIDINGKTKIDNKGDAVFAIGTGGKTLSARFGDADDRPKPFDLKHPSKEGWRLRHACIEGPEVGVYCRGRVRRGKEIFLPKYWKDLVHLNSISVQLQPIGAHQDVIIKRWDDQKIYLQAMGGMPIDCFYHVYAERKDINPLIVEYQGESCNDYPDPNHHTIPDVDRNYNDERYRGSRNTITM